jgi:VanZ family protein
MARTGTRRPVLGVVVGTRRIRDRAFLIADGVPMWGRGFPPTGFGVPAAVPLIIPSLLIGEARQAGGVIRNLLGAAGVRRRDGHDGATGLAKCAEITAPEQMPAGLLRTSLRFLTWCCVAILAFLSLLPAQEMVRTGFPGQLEHFVAYAGSAAIAMSGYGLNRKAPWVIGYFWLCAGILEYLQHFSPGRHPAVEDFAASALGALCGGVAVLLLWRCRSAIPGWRNAA